MNWSADWGADEVIFGFDFADILHEGIELGMAELEFLQQNGMMCDGCGEFRLCLLTNVNRGDEDVLMAYHLCNECRSEIHEPEAHYHTCQQCDRQVGEECYCDTPARMVWCSANCKAAYDL